MVKTDGMRGRDAGLLERNERGMLGYGRGRGMSERDDRLGERKRDTCEE